MDSRLRGNDIVESWKTPPEKVSTPDATSNAPRTDACPENRTPLASPGMLFNPLDLPRGVFADHGLLQSARHRRRVGT
jgi:hypothetical protein